MEHTAAIFRELPGLPGEGPLPEQFSSSGMGTHREGFVVEFYPASKGPWIGNFQPGIGGLSKAILHPDGCSVIVISGGQAYQIDPSSRALLGEFGGAICDCIRVPDRSLLIFSDGIRLRAIGPCGSGWQSERVSWDGIRALSVNGDLISGEAYDPMTDKWKPFSVSLDSGKVSGGSYAEYSITRKA